MLEQIEIRILQEMHRTQQKMMREKIREQKNMSRRAYIIGRALLDMRHDLKDVPIENLNSHVRDIISNINEGRLK